MTLTLKEISEATELCIDEIYAQIHENQKGLNRRVFNGGIKHESEKKMQQTIIIQRNNEIITALCKKYNVKEKQIRLITGLTKKSETLIYENTKQKAEAI